MPTIEIVACLLTDEDGRMLLVRKRGTSAWMQPGGKPEPCETPTGALARELAEELGLEISAAELSPLGRMEAVAANEPGHRVDAHAYALRLDRERADALHAAAEIEEIRWVVPQQATSLPLAPLTAEQFLPLLLG